MNDSKVETRFKRAQDAAIASTKAAFESVGIPFDARKIASAPEDDNLREKMTDGMIGLAMASCALFASSGSSKDAAISTLASILDRCYATTATDEFQDEIRAKAKAMGIEDDVTEDALDRICNQKGGTNGKTIH